MARVARGFLTVGWWICLSMAIGYLIGFQYGHHRGLREALSVIRALASDVEEPPPPWTKGES